VSDAATRHDGRPPGDGRRRHERAERRYLRGPQTATFELVHAVRIFREYVHGLRLLRRVGPCITVFGSARLGPDDSAYTLAQETGARLARAGFTVMTGGGPGLMEAANRGAQAAGGRSIGCNIVLRRGQTPNPYTDRVVTFQHFFIRKVMLVKYSVGFVALPGGYGTFDEVFEAATLIQTGKISDFPVVLLGRDFWEPLADLLVERLLARGTLGPEDVTRLHVVDTPEEAVDVVLLETRQLGLAGGRAAG
jgi:uncharacterized protein (TIGR00730 family)